ncbi:MAG: cupin domain-containing protein [Caldilineaceae bacterium]
MNNFVQPLQHVGSRADKPYKYTVFQSERLLTGLNCLEPGQAQSIHDHPEQDKFYFVLEGSGYFTVGDEAQTCGVGELILAPAGVMHGVENRGSERLTFMTVIAPFPG